MLDHAPASEDQRWWPPSTSILAPTMKPARSEARNATAFAMSSGVPQRPSGTSAPQFDFLLLEAAAEIDLVVELERLGQRALDAARAHGVDEDLVRARDRPTAISRRHAAPRC